MVDIFLGHVKIVTKNVIFLLFLIFRGDKENE